MAYTKVSSHKSASNHISYLFKDGRAVRTTGIDCTEFGVRNEFELVRKLHHKEDCKIQAYSIIQSFEAGTDIDKVHELGVLLAKKIAPNHQVIVYTHTDGEGGKPHNHIVINAINMETGKAFKSSNFLNNSRKISDSLCVEHGLSVIDENKKAKTRYSMAEQGLSLRGIRSWKDEIRVAVKETQDIAINEKDFIERMQERGISVNERAGKWTYYIGDVDKSNSQRVRASRLGEDFTRENVVQSFRSERGQALLKAKILLQEEQQQHQKETARLAEVARLEQERREQERLIQERLAQERAKLLKKAEKARKMIGLRVLSKDEENTLKTAIQSNLMPPLTREEVQKAEKAVIRQQQQAKQEAEKVSVR